MLQVCARLILLRPVYAVKVQWMDSLHCTQCRHNDQTPLQPVCTSMCAAECSNVLIGASSSLSLSLLVNCRCTIAQLQTSELWDEQNAMANSRRWEIEQRTWQCSLKPRSVRFLNSSRCCVCACFGTLWFETMCFETICFWNYAIWNFVWHLTGQTALNYLCWMISKVELFWKANCFRSLAKKSISLSFQKVNITDFHFNSSSTPFRLVRNCHWQVLVFLPDTLLTISFVRQFRD